MKTLFISSLFPTEIKDEVIALSKGAVSNANNELQWNLYNGLKEHFPYLKILNMPNLGAFPIRYKSINVPGCIIHYQNEVIGSSIPFNNLIYTKHYSRFTRLFRALRIEVENTDNLIIFIYDLHPPFLKAITKLKSQYPHKNIHICLIIPDLHGMTGVKMNLFNSYFFNKNKTTINNAYSYTDSYVLISKHMKEAIPIGKKPYVVIEGIAKKPEYQHTNTLNRINKKNINLFYSGAIDNRNGIINLIEAFQSIHNKNYRLVICGDGPLKNYIKKQCIKDPRIIYLGQIPHSEVISLQQHMNLLINPRVPGQDFTKYSFPSKTMEYFSSGTPCLMYRLEGVPSEYFSYCYIAEKKESNDETIQSLGKKIQYICSLPLNERVEVANNAKKFILDTKNPEYQCRKIYKMIKEVSEL